ncbi:FAD/NAD(P)-binding domain-containing protein [Xylaria sp. FL0933]|nr:FAD/NAD(P)-binding domain-containing protein [Xylaria sp. FL0933]
MERLDVVIIGAGLHGLTTARTLVDTSPNEPKRIIILDEGRFIGGTWAAERLYPGLKTNNIVGLYDFSDFPMDLELYGLAPGQHIPGSIVHQYFTDFARHFGVNKRFRLQSRVDTALLRDDGTWELEYKRVCADELQAAKLSCDKLVTATGLTSEARMPTFSGSSEFLGPLFHAKDLHERSKDLKGCRMEVVIDGNKSAWDVCYSVASSGARAHLVIRRSGGSPGRVWRPVYFLGIKLTLARSSSTPSQKTILGVRLPWISWAVLDFLAAVATGYGDPQLEMLRPWTSIFWMFVRNGRIVLYHADVKSLGETTVKLSDGSSLKADAMVCCTGWKRTPPINFRPEGISQEMGMPRAAESCKPDPIKGSWDDSHQFRCEAIGNDLEYQELRNEDIRSWAHAQIRAQCPQLGFSLRRTLPGDSSVRTGWGLYPKLHTDIPLLLNSKEAPYQLYRFLAPPSPRFLKQRKIASIGMHRSVHAMMVAQAQALWVTAFFKNRLRKELDPETVYRSAILHAEYERLRRPRESGGSGASFPDLVFDSIPYTDLLLEDLSLRTMRKPGLRANVMQSHLPADYRGLLLEWLATNG